MESFEEEEKKEQSKPTTIRKIVRTPNSLEDTSEKKKRPDKLDEIMARYAQRRANGETIGKACLDSLPPEDSE